MEVDATQPYEPDEATAILILQLQSEDIEELLRSSEGQGRVDKTSDDYLAVATYQQELQTMNMILADRSMSRSLTRAVISDAALLNESLVEESVAARDRALAHSLAGSIAPPMAPGPTAAVNDLDDGFIARLAALYVSEWNDEEGTLHDPIHSDGPAGDESSARGASRHQASPAASRTCTACNSTKPLVDVCQTPCGHFCCLECIEKVFEMSTTDEALFPPRCCRKAIPLHTVRIYLRSVIAQSFEKKSAELQTSDKIYCSQQACSALIPQVRVADDQATCEDCGTQTCTICKTMAHDGDCPQDLGTQQVLETARQHGWQRCYNCRRLVELNAGCDHIYCPCGAQFCYRCGQLWGTCQCKIWKKPRLIARSRRGIARYPPRSRVRSELQIDRPGTHLRERQQCPGPD